MERAEYHRHSRARMAETAKDASRPPAPDAPERIDHRRRCTRHDHWTCCRGSRGSASLPCHTLRKRVENVPRRFAPECVPASRTGSDDPIFQPAKFSAENPLRELFTGQIHIVSNAAEQTIDA